MQEEGEVREEGTVEGKNVEVVGGWVKVEGEEAVGTEGEHELELQQCGYEVTLPLFENLIN